MTCPRSAFRALTLAHGHPDLATRLALVTAWCERYPVLADRLLAWGN